MQRFQCNSALYSPPAPVCFLSVPCLPTRRAPHGITRNVCNGARNGGCEEAPTDCFCLLGMTSHRLHRSTQMVWVRKILPQIEQNSQNLLLGITSHRLHRFAQKLLISGGALVSSAPTEQTVVLPQISQIYTDGLGAKDPPTDCRCNFRLVYFLLGWCTSCSGKRQSRAETSAPPWRHPNNLCRSVKSVGEYSQQRLLWDLRILWENLCSKSICVNLWNLWENIRSKSEICGRIYAVRVDSVGGHTITTRR